MLEASAIICEISDNGIGRKKATEFSKKYRKNHVSTGIPNIENRLKLLQITHKLDIHFEISDLYDDEKNASGTGVIISIKNKKA